MRHKSPSISTRRVRPYRGFSWAYPWDRVVDIGPGDNPHPRADVVVDLRDNDSERWGSLVDHPNLVVADAHDLPFRDKAFTVAICTHCLEHCADPRRVAGEIERVARRGLLEVPTFYSDALFQPYDAHRWVFARRGDGTLVFAPSPQLQCGSTASTTVGLLRENNLFRHAFLLDQSAFRVRLRWVNRILLEPTTLDEVTGLARVERLTFTRAFIRQCGSFVAKSMDSVVSSFRHHPSFRVR